MPPISSLLEDVGKISDEAEEGGAGGRYQEGAAILSELNAHSAASFQDSWRGLDSEYQTLKDS